MQALPRPPPRLLPPPLVGGSRPLPLPPLPLPPVGLMIPNPFTPPWIYIPIIWYLALKAKPTQDFAFGRPVKGKSAKQTDYETRMIYYMISGAIGLLLFFRIGLPVFTMLLDKLPGVVTASWYNPDSLFRTNNPYVPT